ncbi:DEAD/DEAH box helicase family protein [Halomonas sp. ANAO-440]|uniref:DEAD/DEAH box helicase family protein n=1 Tax=Halomonas sp. ANAO-440 TaxID=2861360 RepID=UPI001CAA700B|nr:DEAD/DEAH box helicase family protein [Halomonas sp. ANAO-440]MBZ0329685.1 DEAD/DEAH box helicase family protein [Halomonas sp. ANAO-440]
MDLIRFQERAATQIANRFFDYSVNPLLVDRTTPVPFLQTLVAITGSGKTLMLADAVSQIRDGLGVAPVVLWISKGRVVVSQTFENLSSGKYADNLSGFSVVPLLEVTPDHLSSEDIPVLLVATVGKFAVEDTSNDDRKVYRAQLDLAEESLWDQLKKRQTAKGLRRPLIIIYDEGHNLSNLQSERLLELAPDALIVASATLTLPPRINSVMTRLRNDKRWADQDFSTTVSSRDVVLSGLVNERISIDGYITPLEPALDNLIGDLRGAQEVAMDLKLPFTPKAIYVCSTNTVDGMSISEDLKRPFKERQARPILIWRHLVEVAKVKPEKIALYCQLKFSKESPKPAEMHLFDGGEKDYARFTSGGYEHVIFNLSLQEGWDDPACCFAYIDKEMASARQITQVIGRVLRQPGAEHYNDPILNTAHFHIRTDEKGVFDDILKDIRRDLTSEHPSIALVIKDEKTRGVRDRIDPKPPRTVPTVGIESTRALEPISRIVKTIIDFRSDTHNTVGQGSRMQVLQKVGENSDAQFEWIDVEHSNRLTARSVFRREINRSYPGGLRRAGGPINLVDIEEPKFDAMIELSSPAADHMRAKAQEVVSAYIQHSVIFQNDVDNPYYVGPIAIDPNSSEQFKRSLHGSYSGLNPLEVKFARALDRTQRVWARNPVGSGYSLPLLHEGKAYWPDFLVWIDKNVVVIDTKGDHLLVEASASKLFEIDGGESGKRILLRLVSEGNVEIENGTIRKRAKSGFTVWAWKNGRLQPTHCNTEKEAVDASLRLD